MTQRSRLHTRVALAAVAALVLSGAAFAADFTWTESGDAGQTLGTAQAVTGDGNLKTIFGDISPVTDIDVYKIFIPIPELFGAAVAASWDTQLFLFDQSGNGVRFNDDRSDSNFTSQIKGFTGTGGTYYLGIAPFNLDPVDGSNNKIFPDTNVGQLGPNAGAGPLFGWSGMNSFNSGRYEISFFGTTGGSAVPEPSSFVLLALGACACFAGRKKEA